MPFHDPPGQWPHFIVEGLFLDLAAQLSYILGMNKTATVRARIEPSLKGEVEHIFSELGISTTEAITLFFKQVYFEQGLPFSVKIPNEKTRKVFEKTDKGVGVIKSNNANDMFKKLGI